jgi:hypothetical protein
VPVSDYPDQYIEQDCDVEPPPVPLPEPVPPIDPGTGGGSTGPTGIDVGEPVPICEVIAVGGGTGAAVLEVGGGRLSLVERAMVDGRTDLYGERVVRAPGGTWLVLSWDRLVGVDGRELVLPTA